MDRIKQSYINKIMYRKSRPNKNEDAEEIAITNEDRLKWMLYFDCYTDCKFTYDVLRKLYIKTADTRGEFPTDGGLYLCHAYLGGSPPKGEIVLLRPYVDSEIHYSIHRRKFKPESHAGKKDEVIIEALKRVIHERGMKLDFNIPYWVLRGF